MRQKQVGDIDSVRCFYGNHARGVLPIHARFTFSDGSTAGLRLSGRGLEHERRCYYVRLYGFKGKKITKIELDPDKRSVGHGPVEQRLAAVTTGVTRRAVR